MALDLGKLNAVITADRSGFRRGVAEARADMRGLQADANTRLASIHQQFGQQGTAAGRAFGGNVRSGAAPGMAGLRRDVNGKLRDARGRFVAEGERAGQGFGDGVNRGAGPGLRRLEHNAERSGHRAGTALSRGLRAGLASLGKVALIGSIVTIAASAASAIGPLVSLVGALGGAMGALPALALGAASAIAVLKIGMAGLSDAIAGDEEAFANLAPSAQKFVTTLRGFKPAWDDIRSAVQQNLFAGLATDLKSVADVWLPKLKDALPGIATSFRDVGRGIADGLVSDEFQSGMDRIFASTESGLSKLATGMSPLIQAIGTLGGAFAPALDAVGAGIASLAAKFNDFIQAANESGALSSFVATLGDQLSTLGTVLGNIGSIFASVFSAASATGGGLLGTLEQLTGTARDFFNSAEGQDALTGFFTGLQDLAGAVMPILTTLATGIGTVLAPAVSDIAAELGPALQTVATALVDGLSKIDIGPLASGLADLLAAASPVLPVLGELLNVVSQAAGPILSAFATALEPIAAALESALSPDVLSPMTEAFALLGGQLAAAAVEIGPMLAEVMAQLAPVLVQLATILVEQLVPIVERHAETWVEMLNALIPVLPVILQLVVAAVQLIAPLLQVGSIITTSVISAVVWLWNVGQGLGSWLRGAFVAALNIAGAALDWIGGVFSACADWVVGAWDSVTSFFENLPGNIMGFLSGLYDDMVGLGGDIVSGILAGINNLGSQIGDTLMGWAQDAWSSVKGFFGIASPSKLMKWAGEMIGRGLIGGIEGTRGAVARAANTLAAAANPPLADGPLLAAGGGYTARAAGIPTATISDTVLERLEAMLAVRPDTVVEVDGVEIARAADAGGRELARRY